MDNLYIFWHRWFIVFWFLSFNDFSTPIEIISIPKGFIIFNFVNGCTNFISHDNWFFLIIMLPLSASVSLRYRLLQYFFHILNVWSRSWFLIVQFLDLNVPVIGRICATRSSVLLWSTCFCSSMHISIIWSFSYSGINLIFNFSVEDFAAFVVVSVVHMSNNTESKWKKRIFILYEQRQNGNIELLLTKEIYVSIPRGMG